MIRYLVHKGTHKQVKDMVEDRGFLTFEVVPVLTHTRDDRRVEVSVESITRKVLAITSFLT